MSCTARERASWCEEEGDVVFIASDRQVRSVCTAVAYLSPRAPKRITRRSTLFLGSVVRRSRRLHAEREVRLCLPSSEQQRIRIGCREKIAGCTCHDVEAESGKDPQPSRVIADDASEAHDRQYIRTRWASSDFEDRRGRGARDVEASTQLTEDLKRAAETRPRQCNSSR